MVPGEPWCHIYKVSGVRESLILVVVVGGTIHCSLLSVLPNSDCPLGTCFYVRMHFLVVLPLFYDVAGGSFRPYVFKPWCHAYCGSLGLFRLSPLLFGGANWF